MTPTRYEIAVSLPNGQRWLLGYTARRTVKSVVAMIRQHRDAIRAKMGPQELDYIAGGERGMFLFKAPDGSQIGPTGRTQLDAQNLGELEPIADNVYAPKRVREE